jgi:hypothetical protein
LIGSEFLISELKEIFDEVYSYNDQIYNLKFPQFQGTFYGHFYPSGSMMRATPLRQVLSKTHGSFISSHNHTGGIDSQRKIDGTWMHHVNVGTFQPPHRLKPGEKSGVYILNDMKNGDFMPQFYSYDWVMENYGDGDYAQRLRTARANEQKDRQSAQMAFGA